MPFDYASPSATILVGDCLARMREIPDGSVRTCVTSPPYWGLRDYGVAEQIGLEDSPAAYVERIVAVFRDVRRTLADDGTLWLNLGDGYAGGAKSTNVGNAPSTASTLRGSGPRPGEKYSSTSAIPRLRPGNPEKNGGVSNRDGLGRVPGLKSKDLVGIPWLVAFALRADGWYLRQDLIWHKLNPMPESVVDRCTKAHEYVFLLSKSARYYFDARAIAERIADPVAAERARRSLRTNDGYSAGSGRNERGRHTSAGFANPHDTRNRRSVWTIASQPYSGAHFATMPSALVEPCVLAGSALGDLVLDPFAGAGTTGLVALGHGRRFIGCELNPAYAAMAWDRIRAARTLADEMIELAAPQEPEIVFGY